MLPLLLLSGAGLPAWIWDDVCARLATETRVAPRPGPGGSLHDYSRAAMNTAGGWDTFGVVAHSAGGVVAMGLDPERVTGVLGVSALVPRPGGSFTGALPMPQRFVMPLLLRVAGTRPPAKEIRTGSAGEWSRRSRSGSSMSSSRSRRASTSTGPPARTGRPHVGTS